MQAGVVTVTLLLAVGFAACHRAQVGSLTVSPQKFATSSLAAPSKKAAKKPDFDTEIKPIFQARCQPCHFQGGQVYDKMPFDKPETINRLGTKLFTRIKDEKEQRLIREFLAQP